MKSIPTITATEYHSIEKMFGKLKMTESWRGKIPTQDGFNKEEKEALNVIIFAFLKEIMLPADENLNGLPAYILRRLYKKAYSWDTKPKNKKFFEGMVGKFDETLETYIMKVMKAEGIEEFSKFLREEVETLSPKAIRVYKAARVLGTLIEYEELSDKLRPDTKEETHKQVYEDLKLFADLPHFTEIANGTGEFCKMKKLIRTISASRYTFRWQGYIAPIRCSILAHMLEAAVIGYLANLELGRETDMLQDFWVLMFHDLPEIWTDDIPSPVKDGVEIWNPTLKLVETFDRPNVTFREVTEVQELEALEFNFYSCLPNTVGEFFKKGVMLEDVEDKDKKRFYKSADYFSADLEVWWNIKGGSREESFHEILLSSISGNRTPAEKELLKVFTKKCEGVTFF